MYIGEYTIFPYIFWDFLEKIEGDLHPKSPMIFEKGNLNHPIWETIVLM